MTKKRVILVLVFCASVISLLFLKKSLFFQKRLLIKIPIEFERDSATLKAKVEEIEYILKLDWGLPVAWALESQILGRVKEKKLKGSFKYRDIKGNPYLSRAFQIPLIKISGLDFENLLGLEENDDFRTKGVVIWNASGLESNSLLPPIQGKIGRELFRAWNLVFDFSHNSLYLTHAESLEIKKIFYSEGCAELPFEESRNGTVIAVSTDLGIKRFLLDTGAFRSVLRKSLVAETDAHEIGPGKWLYTSNRFELGNSDFGDADFILFEMTSYADDIDGILGIDFFKNHLISLDFTHNVAYIQKTPSAFAEGPQNKGRH